MFTAAFTSAWVEKPHDWQTLHAWPVYAGLTATTRTPANAAL